MFSNVLNWAHCWNVYYFYCSPCSNLILKKFDKIKRNFDKTYKLYKGTLLILCNEWRSRPFTAWWQSPIQLLLIAFQTQHWSFTNFIVLIKRQNNVSLIFVFKLLLLILCLLRVFIEKSSNCWVRIGTQWKRAYIISAQSCSNLIFSQHERNFCLIQMNKWLFETNIS